MSISHQQQQPKKEALPVIVRDPRYVVGRATIGQSTSIDVFETLLHEAIVRYGGGDGSDDDDAATTASKGNKHNMNINEENTDTIIETAPAYYEYGNALLRFAIRQREEKQQQEEQDDDKDDEEGHNDPTSTIKTTKSTSERHPDSKVSIREAIAAAAEQRRINEVMTKSMGTASAKNETANEIVVVDSSSDVIHDVKKHAADIAVAVAAADNDNDNINKDDNDEEEEEEETNDMDDSDDIELALEMMETSWSILDAYTQDSNNLEIDDTLASAVTSTSTFITTKTSNTDSTSSVTNPRTKYSGWVTEQIPRVWTGMGDARSVLGRHADAVEAYLRALDYRQTILNSFLQSMPPNILSASSSTTMTTATTLHHTHTTTNSDLPSQVQLLKYRRQVVEVTVLVVEELLACGNDHDVVTTTTEQTVVLVSQGNVVDYARGYYDRARTELQETVLLLGQIVAMIPTYKKSNHSSSTTNITTTTTKMLEQSIQEEKENICYVATMIMGVGTTLAEMDDLLTTTSHQSSENETNMEPKPKKSKST